MLERHEMLAPQPIERLQQDGALDLAHDLRTEIGGLLGEALVGRLDQPLMDLGLADTLLRGPIGERQVESENVVHRLFQRRDVPLLGIRLLGDRS